MNRATSLTLILLAVAVALTAAAQESGGLRLPVICVLNHLNLLMQAAHSIRPIFHHRGPRPIRGA
jgi:hypothetical protein